MKEKITIWRGQDGDLKPVECRAIEYGWPHDCINTETNNVEKMYNNTHFLTKNEAWVSIYQSVLAGIELAKRDVETARINYDNAVNNRSVAKDDLKIVLMNIPKELI